MDDAAHKRRFGTVLHLDHIVPHGGDARLFNDELNWQLLCVVDHNAKSAREQGGGYTR